MGLIERLDGAIALFGRGAEHGVAVAQELRAIATDASAAPQAAREALIGAVCTRLEEAPPALAPQLAFVAAVQVEGGMAPGSLGPAIFLPVSRALEAAARDPAAEGSLETLEAWLAPTVATWSRDRDTLRRAQQSERLRAHVATLAGRSEAAWWLARLLVVCIDAPFVVLVPELQEAWALRLDGCVDNSQFLVLLSAALSDPLRRLGVDAPAPAALLANARGEGPPQVAGSYGARFALYAWQAIDPESSRPVNGKFTWIAPGGRGDIWLPGDYPPSHVTLLEERRVVALVVSTATRVIGGGRIFQGLAAGITDVRRLDEAEASRWTDPIAPRFFAPKPRWWH